MSYNILADLYADSDFSREHLFPQCPPYALGKTRLRPNIFLGTIYCAFQTLCDFVYGARCSQSFTS